MTEMLEVARARQMREIRQVLVADHRWLLELRRVADAGWTLRDHIERLERLMRELGITNDTRTR